MRRVNEIRRELGCNSESRNLEQISQGNMLGARCVRHSANGERNGKLWIKEWAEGNRIECYTEYCAGRCTGRCTAEEGKESVWEARLGIDFRISCVWILCSVKPEDRSPSKLCRRSAALRHRVRYIHLDSSILTLVLAIFILSLNAIFHPDLCGRRVCCHQMDLTLS